MWSPQRLLLSYRGLTLKVQSQQWRLLSYRGLTLNVQSQPWLLLSCRELTVRGLYRWLVRHLGGVNVVSPESYLSTVSLN